MSSFLGSVPIVVVVMAVELLLIRSVSSMNLTNAYLNHNCNNTQGKYDPGSLYEKNLNFAIRNISTYDLRTGYIYTSNVEPPYKRAPPDSVFIVLQCRGDSYGRKCHSCLATALKGLRERCPRNKGGIIWYDQCLLEISSTTNDDSRIYYENFFMFNTNNMSGDPESFKKKWKDLIQKLIKIAIKRPKNEQKGPLYAAGETMFGTKKLYGMVQCTQDLYDNSCDVCQEWITERYPDCCKGIHGARVVGRSCSFRYEFYPFVGPSKTL